MSRLFAALALLVALASPLRAACVTDDAGAEICLNGAAKRAISLYGAYTETVVALGAGKTLVARTKNDDTEPTLLDLPVIGTGLRPDVEHLLAMNPDLVVARGSKAGDEALTALRERGVVTAAFDPRTVEELYSVIERLGVLFGREAEAKTLVAAMRGRLDDVRAKTAALPGRPVVAYEVRADPLTLAGQDGILSEMVEIAGGKLSVETQKKLVRLDMEALLASDPDVYVVQEGPMNRAPSAPAERPFHAKLRAVKAGRVLFVDEKLMSRPGPRLPEAVETLARFLHPEAFPPLSR